MAYLAIMLRLYTRAKLNDETYFVEKFLTGLLNEALRNEIIMHHKGAQTYKTMRKAVVECHASFTKAIRMGTGTLTFNLTGLAQQSNTASLDTYNQWKRRTKAGNAKDTESMDLTHVEGTPQSEETLFFFMGHDDMDIRDQETKEDLGGRLVWRRHIHRRAHPRKRQCDDKGVLSL